MRILEYLGLSPRQSTSDLSRRERVENGVLFAVNMIGVLVGVDAYRHSALHNSVVRLGLGVAVSAVACALLSGIALAGIALANRARRRH